MLTPETIVKVISFFIPFLFSLCFHEYAHGWVAKRLGDNTAKVMGRLTLNPLAHIDWLGTVALPIFSIISGMTLFGWAKPVPVNANNLRHPRNDMFWVALAGPMSNILLFVVGVIFLAIIGILQAKQIFFPSVLMFQMVMQFLTINLILAFFNLIPINPLDGGKILGRFLPIKWDMWLEAHQSQTMIILMLLVIFGGFSFLALPITWVVEHSIGLIDTLIGHL